MPKRAKAIYEKVDINVYKYRHVLANLYERQILGHVCYSAEPLYLSLSACEKRFVRSVLKFFNLSSTDKELALKLITQKYPKEEVMQLANISFTTYMSLRYKPIVRKYVYGEDIEAAICLSCVSTLAATKKKFRKNHIALKQIN